MPRLPVLLSNVAPMVAVGKGPKVTPLGVVAGAADKEGATSRSGGGGAAPVGGLGAVGAVSPTLRGAPVMATEVGAGLVMVGAMGGVVHLREKKGVIAIFTRIFRHNPCKIDLFP